MLRFLRCIGEAVAAKGLRMLAGLAPMGEQLYDIANDAIRRYRMLHAEDQLRSDFEAVIQAAPEVVQAEADAIAADVLMFHPDEEIARLTQFLNHIPAVARQSLRRPENPQGTTIPSHADLLDPKQISGLLPTRLPTFQSGQSVPHAPQWRLVKLLGTGGFGEVWLAQHSFLDDQRAFKFCLDPVARDRLLRYEGEIVRSVMRTSQFVRADQHGIVPLLDAYLEGDFPWLAYEYIHGGDLSGVIRSISKRSPFQRGEIAYQCLKRLAKIIGSFHTQTTPIIHRDLKPANILLKPIANGQHLLKVTDFGISQIAADHEIQQLTRSTPRQTLGATYRGSYTPLYASPQQKRGHRPDPRDDVHALGIITWQLLIGDLEAERPAGRWRRRLADYQIPDAFLELLESCWDDDPSERPANAAELAAKLQSCPVTGKPPATAPVANVAPPPPEPEEPSPATPAREFAQPVPPQPVEEAPPAATASESDGVPIQIPIKGRWYAAALDDFDWKKVCSTPADVIVRPSEHYRLDVSRSITDKAMARFQELESLTNLTDVSFKKCLQFSESSLEFLTKLTSIMDLSFDGCLQITDDAIAIIKPLHRLVDLDLSECEEITDQGIAHLREFPDLMILDIRDCSKITDRGLELLQSLSKLQYLYLEGFRHITDESLKILSRLSQLIVLDLTDCQQITDAGLAHLIACQQLESLDLSFCAEITDTGLMQLTQLPKLETLTIINCKNISISGMNQFREVLPKCKIRIS
ncbi:protein kinase domain-containing protein [Tuwongella immobilis]|uniref:Protein kinase domain-containing protein n=1 Tax=Tuwongella immobilis TaxID=692036 RepID=A0A6C2YJ37_9BACT|nr:protein kinase [Tuwongella immobilis]VIP01259.1 serine threonine protein kinase : Serine/threonine protein kinase OS=Isosphaera pallida (strain ATCC 43644 / DSM 9630 / IS1B) GN=Isop_1435 PE=3 SV=1: Pkinase: LRR_6: LRR_6: LRR_6 [Tuwongella immobilis]VTR97944.1 serine threonine protein kinase : Serine/threonine protein kinase OS=Isosphaera pallida (strain ATCC 43644 / DSM 9630 / IS1B) GN=Isop_1435 PE=3 SV=1: Pkinase: LRR_6: LRR_6: LRR_6 [Tuwongella immobilis]